MLKAKDFRMRAWTDLNGKWGTVALITFVYILIMGVCSLLARYYVGTIASFVTAGPFALSFAIIALNVVRGKQVEFKMLFSGFNNFGKAFLLNLLNGIFVFLWSLLLIIPGIIKAYSYAMSIYILADNPEISANEARKKSIEMMHGNKWRLFCLSFSFIGWVLLCGITLGILSFWIVPYMNASFAAFYQSLFPKGEAEEIEANEVEQGRVD